MATSRFSPAISVANQIRQGHLGVKTGGAQGRSTSSHKGVGLNRNSGGLNTKGSARSVPGVSMVPRGTPAPVSATKPRAIGNDPYRYVTRNGQKVLVRWSRMTAAERGLYGNSLANKANAPASTPTRNTPVPRVVTPAPSRSVAYAPTGPLDYSNLTSYKSNMADLEFDLRGQRDDLRNQIPELTTLYNRNKGDAKDQYADVLEDMESDLSRAGLLRSGAREKAEADQFKEFDRYLAEIEEQYGSIALGKITDALSRLDEFETLEKRKVEDAARAEHAGWEAERIALDEQAKAAMPSAPTTPAPRTPAPTAPRPAGPPPVSSVPKNTPAPKFANGLSGDMFSGSHLYRWNAKTKRNDTVDINRLTHAEALQLLGRDINKRLLTNGYYYDNGKIYKR